MASSSEFEESNTDFAELTEYNRKILQALNEDISALPDDYTFCKNCLNNEIKQMKKELEYLSRYEESYKTQGPD